MLLVDYGEAERAELNVFLEQRMRADCDRHFSRGNGGKRGSALLLCLASGKPCRFQPQGAEPLAELAEMLLGENFRRGHDCGLQAVLDRAQRGEHGNDGLAAAHVSLQQPVHRMRLRKISFNFFPYPLLRASQLERQSLDQYRGMATLLVRLQK